MNLLLAFAPFIAFVIIERIFGTFAGLASGALISAAILVRDLMSSDRQVKILEIGTFLLFGGLAVYAVVFDASWSIAEVRLRVDAGLMLIVLASMALRQPFTLQYAREKVSKDKWNAPTFVRTNYAITFAWALAFGTMVVADLLMAYAPSVSPKAGIAITVVALYAAVKFTKWFPEKQRAALGA